MSKIYGVPRPYATWGIEWTGGNIQEIKDEFSWYPENMIFVNEENDNLCFGSSVEESNQYPLGTIMLLLGGVNGFTQEEWNSQFSTVASNGRLKYNVLQDEES